MRTSPRPGRSLPRRTLWLFAATVLAMATIARVSGDEPSAAPSAKPGTEVSREAAPKKKAPPAAPQRKSSRSRSTTAFALVGIAGYGEHSVALFDGTDAGFKQMLHPGETIGSFTLLTISSDHVELQSDTNVVQLPLQKQLRMEDGGTWRVQDLATPFTPSNVQPVGTLASTSRSFSYPTDRSGSSGKSNRDAERSSSSGEFSSKELKKAEKAMNPDATGGPSRKKMAQVVKAAKKMDRRTRPAE